MAEAARRAAQRCPGSRRSTSTRTTPTTRAQSYGSHENYLMRRATPFADIVRHLTPFFVSRQVVCGAGPGRHRPGRPRRRLPDLPAGRLLRGRGRPGDHAQAADHQHPRRAARRRRASTAGCTSSSATPTCPRSPTYLKVGTTSLVLAMIEDKVPRPWTWRSPSRSPTLRAVCHDPALKHLITLRDGRRLTALQLQMEYLERARKYVEDRFGDDVDAQTADVLDRWESVLDRLERDPMLLRRRAGLGGQAAAAGGLPGARRAGLGLAQAAAGRPAVLRRPAGEGPLPPAGRPRRDGAAARRGRGRSRPWTTPPEDTRAYFRGRCLAAVRRRGRGRLLGLGDLRRGPGVAGAGPDDGAAAGHQGARRGAVRPLPDGGRARGGPHRRVESHVPRS